MSESMMFDGKQVLNDLTGVLVAHVNGNQPITGNHIEKAIQAISTLINQRDALIADAKLSTLPPGKVLCDANPVRFMCPDNGGISTVDRVGWIPLYAAAKGE